MRYGGGIKPPAWGLMRYWVRFSCGLGRFVARCLACVLAAVVLMLFLKARGWDSTSIGIAGAVLAGALVGAFALEAKGLSTGRRTLACGAGILAGLFLEHRMMTVMGHGAALLIGVAALASGVASGVNAAMIRARRRS